MRSIHRGLHDAAAGKIARTHYYHVFHPRNDIIPGHIPPSRRVLLLPFVVNGRDCILTIIIIVSGIYFVIVWRACFRTNPPFGEIPLKTVPSSTGTGRVFIRRARRCLYTLYGPASPVRDVSPTLVIIFFLSSK